MTAVGSRPRVHVLLAGALLVVLVYLVAVWVSGVPAGNLHTGDSETLVAGTRVAIRCIEHGTLTSCGVHPGTRQTAVGPYPLLQYPPAAVLVQLGLTDDQVLTVLARLNVVAFGGAIVLCLVAFNGRDRRACRALAIVAVLASTATYQSSAAFGEMFAATVTLGAVVATIKRKPVLILVATAFAVLSKETFAPFVLAVGVLAGRDERDGWLPPKDVLVPLIVGAVTGTLAAVAFNLFRFGELWNTFYLDPRLRTPGILRPVEFFAGVWASPAAGLTWYWPVATAIVIGMAVVTGLRIRRSPRYVAQWLPSAALVVIALAFTAGLALWFSPFGWVAYGPRLAVPLIPAIVVVALHQEAPGVERLARTVLRTSGGAVAVIGVLVILGWPQFGAAWSYKPAITQLATPNRACPPHTRGFMDTDPSLYYSCVTHLMWRTNELPLVETASGGGAPASWARILLATGVALLVLDARHRARRRPPAGTAADALAPAGTLDSSRVPDGDGVRDPDPGEWDHASLR